MLKLCCVFLALIWTVNGYCEIKAFIVFQHRAGFRANWEEIKKDVPEKLVLIRYSHLGTALKESEKMGFDAIHFVDQFHQKQLIDAIAPYILEFGAENVRIISNDEYALSSAAEIRQLYHVPGPSIEETEKFRNKALMKTLVAKAGLRIPLFLQFDPIDYTQDPDAYLNHVIKTLQLPIFIKPIDGASSDETAKVYTKKELDAWMQGHLKDSRLYELDEFIVGELYHCDTLVQAGKPLFFSIGKQLRPCFEFTQGVPLATYMLDPEDPEYEMLKSFNDQVFKALGSIANGGTHLEVFITHDFECVFLEIANRTPGAYVPQCYDKMYGFPFEEAAFRLMMDKPSGIQTQQKNYAGYIFFPKMEGLVKELSIPQVRSHLQHEFFVKSGDKIEHSTENLLGIAGKVLIWNTNKKELLNDLYQLFQEWPITIEGAHELS